jgi:hypothetical protein
LSTPLSVEIIPMPFFNPPCQMADAKRFIFFMDCSARAPSGCLEVQHFQFLKFKHAGKGLDFKRVPSLKSAFRHFLNEKVSLYWRIVSRNAEFISAFPKRALGRK